MAGKAQHYLELDGLRGVAAVAVVLYHQNEFQPAFSHGYLAVDFFFLLSGFVLEHAYGERLRAGRVFMPYLRDRLIRLYPLIIVGALLGAAAALVEHKLSGSGDLLLRGLLTLLLLPGPHRCGGYGCLLDPPLWSLSVEVIANVAFAMIAPWMSRKVLLAIVAVSGAAMLWMSAHYHGFAVSVLPHGAARSVVRVALSFFGGVLLYRLSAKPAKAAVLPPRRLWVAPLLLLSFVFSFGEQAVTSRLYDPIVVMLLYPGLLLAGANSTPIYAPVTRFSGEISYPLYVLHLPLLTLMLHGAGAFSLTPTFWLSMCNTAVVVVLSWLTLVYYDVPLRAILRRRWGGGDHRRPPEEDAIAPSTTH